MRQHSGGVVSNQSLNAHRPAAFDPGRIVYCPKSHLQTGDFRFLDETLARDLGPRIAHAVLPIAGKGSSDWGYAWIPIVGPIVGGVLAALVYQLVWKV